MKTRSLFYSALCALLVGSSLTACSSDDDPDEPIIDGIRADRVFILNEGVWEKNNAGISLYDTQSSTLLATDIFYAANQARLGDVGQDMMEYEGSIYVIVSGSQYITRLDASGKEQARYAFSETEGQPRYMTADDGKVYVTLYSGNVARMDAKTLAMEKMVKVGNNPEGIIEEDGKLYLLNSGWGSDNRLSIIDTRTFASAEHVEVFTNPDQIIEVDDRIIIQGYGADYDYPVAVFEPMTKTYRPIGQGTHIAGYGSTLYVVYSATDWNTNITTNTFYTYDVRTGSVNEASFLKDAPAALASSRITMLSINDENGEIYIGTSDYTTNGDVYRFRNNGTFVEQFESGGVGPRRAVFMGYNY